MAEDTTKEVEQEEPQQGNTILSNLVQMIILFWSLGVISFAYFGNSNRQIDTTFAAGLLSAVMSNMGLQVKASKNGKKKLNKVNIVDNKNNNVGIK
tara:strand:+ start:232 stop:519 length:288 start_codon:yes stop_codon:yes gene_type:complete